ncbi:MAG: gcn5-related n-acetyltransferase [Frankiales bacterium]|nr:gcn5-related n-acetyltransferase [Frankiales bacterium]
MELRSVPFGEAQELTAAMVAELNERYGEDGSASPAEGADFLPPYGVFLVVTVDGQDVACGGLRLLEPGIGEVKRMYAAPEVRGGGLARRVLRALLEHAGSVGLREVWLETGTLQPEAIALYESEGFAPIPRYGYFKDEPLSLCYARRL